MRGKQIRGNFQLNCLLSLPMHLRLTNLVWHCQKITNAAAVRKTISLFAFSDWFVLIFSFFVTAWRVWIKKPLNCFNISNSFVFCRLQAHWHLCLFVWAYLALRIFTNFYRFLSFFSLNANNSQFAGKRIFSTVFMWHGRFFHPFVVRFFFVWQASFCSIIRNGFFIENEAHCKHKCSGIYS